MDFLRQLLSLALITSIMHSNFAFAGRHGSEGSGYASDGERGRGSQVQHTALPRPNSVPVGLSRLNGRTLDDRGAPPEERRDEGGFEGVEFDPFETLHSLPDVSDGSSSEEGGATGSGVPLRDAMEPVTTSSGSPLSGSDEPFLAPPPSAGSESSLLTGSPPLSASPSISGCSPSRGSGGTTFSEQVESQGSEGREGSPLLERREEDLRGVPEIVVDVLRSQHAPHDGCSIDPALKRLFDPLLDGPVVHLAAGDESDFARFFELYQTAKAGDQDALAELTLLYHAVLRVRPGADGREGFEDFVMDLFDRYMMAYPQLEDVLPLCPRQALGSGAAGILGGSDEEGSVEDHARDLERGHRVTLDTFRLAREGNREANRLMRTIFRPVLQPDEVMEVINRCLMRLLIKDMTAYMEQKKRARAMSARRESSVVRGPATERTALMDAVEHREGARDGHGPFLLGSVVDMEECESINGVGAPPMVVYGAGAHSGKRTLPPTIRALLRSGGGDDDWDRFTKATTYIHDQVIEDRLSLKQKIMIGAGIAVAIWAVYPDLSIFSDGLRYILLSFGVPKEFLNSNTAYLSVYGSFLILTSLTNGGSGLASLAKSFFSLDTDEFVQSEYRWNKWKVRFAKLGVAIPFAFINWFYFSYAVFEYWEDAKKLNEQGQHNNLSQFPIGLGTLSPAILLKYGMIGWALATTISKGPFKWFFGGRDLPLDTDPLVRQYRVEGLKMCTRLLHGLEHVPDDILEVMFTTFTSLNTLDEGTPFAQKMFFALQMHRLMTQYDAVLKGLEIIPEEEDELSPVQHRVSMGTAIASLPMGLVGFWLVYMLFGHSVAQIPESIANYSSWVPAVLTLAIVFPWIYHAVAEFFEGFWSYRQGPHDSHTFPKSRTAAHYWSGGEGPFRSITEIALALQVAEKMPGGDTWGGKIGYLAAGSPFIGAHALGNMAEIGQPYDDLTSFRAYLRYGPERRICGLHICGGHAPTREYKQDVLHRLLARYKEFLRTAREDVLSTHRTIADGIF